MAEQLEQRAWLIRRLILIGFIFVVIRSAAEIGGYYRMSSWYSLAGLGGSLLAALGLAVAYGLARRDRTDLAAWCIMLALLLELGSRELLWFQSPLFALGRALLVLLMASILFRRRWGIWVASVVLYGALTFWSLRFAPLPPRDMTSHGELLVISLLTVSVLVVGGVWRYLAFRGGIRTLRARMLMTFVPLSLLLALIIGASALLLARNQVRNQLENQLESVATLKHAEIRSWLDDLLISLNVVASDPRVVMWLDEITTSSPTSDTPAHERLQEHLEWAIEQMGFFEELFVLDTEGRVMLSTDPNQQGKVYEREPFFREGREEPYVHPPTYSPSFEKTVVWVARPVVDEAGNLSAVLAGRADMGTLSEIMLERAGLGETGETYLVGSNYALLTASRFEDVVNYVRTEGTLAAVERRENGVGQYESYRGTTVLGVYHWLPEFQVALIAEQETSEAFQGIRTMLVVDAGIAVGAVLFVSFFIVVITNNITGPLARLAHVAERIAAGDRDLVATDVERTDEIGALARAFNSMTQQLRELIDSLEQRVADRTRQLEQRSAYLEASAEVSRAVISILERDRLLQEVVTLVRERFDLYYVGLFLVEGPWAVLRAGTGEAGRAMLAEGHRLRVGGDSMIGQCVEHGEARIALDVGEEAVRFENPHLPLTRSEGALPLRSRGRVLGAITIQSQEPEAFDQDVITLFQTMADQVATALDNARLFAEVQQSLEAERRAYGELSRQAWAELLRARPSRGYDYLASDLVPARDDDWTPEMQEAVRRRRSMRKEDGSTLIVPLRVRESVIGVLSFDKGDADGAWTAEEQGLLERLAEELGQALESARLYEDAQRRAAREQLLGELTAQIRETLDMERILQTVVTEVRDSLKVKEAEVYLGRPSEIVTLTSEEEEA
ncbi:MAG: GAF domain-containing protein [Anaerolineae bacterium]